MDNPHIFLSLLFYGMLGLIGQGVRAVVGLGSMANPGNPAANQQNVFNAAYLLFTLMIGFIAGFLAGLVNFDHVTDAMTLKTALGVMAAGYAGADFIENTYSKLTGALLGTASAGQPPIGPQSAAALASAAAPDGATAQRLRAAEDRLSRLEAITALPPPPPAGAGLSAGAGPG